MRVQDLLDSAPDLQCEWFEVLTSRRHELFDRVEGGDRAVPGCVSLVHDQIAGQQEADVSFGGERLVSQGWVTGSEDTYSWKSTSSFFLGASP